MNGAAGTAAGGGGDLSGGGDDQRNAQLERLRNIFAAPDAAGSLDDSVGAPSKQEKEDASRLGLLLDLPLCRYSWCLLPGHQIAMSVWQPQYTLMFNRLLSEPGPHYYLHVLMPGGAESLGEPGYELEPGSKASLMGTLCRVAVGQRNADSTLTLVVQGLDRVRTSAARGGGRRGPVSSRGCRTIGGGAKTSARSSRPWARRRKIRPSTHES